MERKIQLEVITPIIAGYPKNYFGFRVFTKADFSSFKIVPWNFEVTNDEIEQYIKAKGLTQKEVKVGLSNIIKEIIDMKTDNIEKEYTKLGYVKLDYIFPRRHYDVDKVITINDYYDWIDWWGIFNRPLRIILSKDFGIEADINDIKIDNIKLNVTIFFFSSTKVPVFHESIAPGSKFTFDINSNSELDNIDEKVVQVGRSRRYGYGKVRIIID